MNKLVVASNNQGKIKEIKEILKDFQLEVFSLKDLQIDIDIIEDGNTFMDNAYKKAKEIHNITKGYMVLADDSGLMVDSLNGAPGVLSARFSGTHGDDEKNNEKLLNMLVGRTKDDRKARFVCALVLIIDDYREIKVQEQVEGNIIESKRGKDGFGYDPLFYIPEMGKTFAEMTSNEKNSISHRGKALNKLKYKLKNQF